MKEQGKIYDQHSENNEFKSKLNFYKDELDLLHKRLDEIASKNNKQDVMKQVEHFENQFTIQKQNINRIGHSIIANETELINEIRSNPTAVDHRKVEDHKKQREMVEGFEKNMNEIRDEFKRFSAKWM